MSDDMQVGVMGVGGRMGTMLVKQILKTPGLELAGGSVRGHPAELDIDIGMRCGTRLVGIDTSLDPATVFEASEVVIDFTLPDAVELHAKLAAQTGTALVVGTTGLDAAGEAALTAAAKAVPIVYAPNMSLGVNLLLTLVEQVARALNDGFDIEVFELHHNRKIDAPSGTALGLGRAAARGRGVDFDKAAILSREGETGARKRGQIGFAALRGGDVVGEHSVIFAGAGERVEIAHKAAGREIYAAGALEAARWVRGKDAGLYAMTDVLGLTDKG